jgi:hypothetical protein
MDDQGISLEALLIIDNATVAKEFHEEEEFGGATYMQFVLNDFGGTGDYILHIDAMIIALDYYATGFVGSLHVGYCEGVISSHCLQSNLIQLDSLKIGLPQPEVKDVCDELESALYCPDDYCVEGNLVLFMSVFGGLLLLAGMVLFMKTHKSRAAERKRKAMDTDKQIAKELGISRTAKTAKAAEDFNFREPPPMDEQTVQVAQVEVEPSVSASPRSYATATNNAYTTQPMGMMPYGQNAYATQQMNYGNNSMMMNNSSMGYTDPNMGGYNNNNMMNQQYSQPVDMNSMQMYGNNDPMQQGMYDPNAGMNYNDPNAGMNYNDPNAGMQQNNYNMQ